MEVRDADEDGFSGTSGSGEGETFIVTSSTQESSTNGIVSTTTNAIVTTTTTTTMGHKVEMWHEITPSVYFYVLAATFALAMLMLIAVLVFFIRRRASYRKKKLHGDVIIHPINYAKKVEPKDGLKTIGGYMAYDATMAGVPASSTTTAGVDGSAIHTKTSSFKSGKMV
jgi:hypothetical protein